MNELRTEKKISGWVRLWLFFAFLYLLPVIYITWLNFPITTSEVYKNWYIELYNQASKIDILYQNQSYSEFQTKNSKLTYPQLISTIELDIISKRQDYVEKCKTNPNPFCDLPFNDEVIKNKYETELNNHSFISPLTFLTNAFLLWFIPLLVIFIIGYLIAWVIDGFSPK